MPVLMEMLGYKHELDFQHTTGAVIKIDLPIDTDVCATIYYPDPDKEQSRATLTGGLLQIELPLRWAHADSLDTFIESLNDRQEATYNTYVAGVLEDFGLQGTQFARCELEVVKQKYAKILPIPDRERKKFIMWATDNWGIYSLGRFGIWKPGLLLDDVFTDIQRIQRMIAGSNYEGKKS
jgi:hypothetical protein